ncbi:MAG: tetratricopeptide repeat protein [Crocinitomicaceae bacterium]
MKKISLLLLCFFSFCVSAQDISELNHYKSLLNTTKDTAYINVLNQLASLYSDNDVEKAMEYAEKALHLSQKIKFIEGETSAYSNIGSIHYNKAEYDQALEFHQKAKALSIATKNRLNEATALNNIGLIYDSKGIFDKALTNYLQANKISASIGDKKLEARSLNNIAIIYKDNGNYKTALEFYFKVLKIKREIGDKQGEGNTLNNLGILYKDLKQFDKSLECYQEALAIRTAINDQPGLGLTLNNFGSLYDAKQEYNKAYPYYEKALVIWRKIKDDYNLSLTLNALGLNYFYRGDINKAIETVNKSLDISKKRGIRQFIKNGYQTLTVFYISQNNYKAAFENYELCIAQKDTMISLDNAKQINELQVQFETEKKQQEIKLLTKESQIQNYENGRNKMWLGFLLVLVLLIFTSTALIYNRYKIKRNANTILEQQNVEINQQKKEITDSINYAKRIQESILPPDEYWQKTLPNSFIFYKPKDIVSGDFYWIEKRENKVLFAAVDCTGHGVPGALMSVVGFNLLSAAVNEGHLTNPAEILSYLDDGVTKTLRQSGDGGGVKDGMDLALCSFDTKTLMLEYAGAFNSLYYCRNGVLNEIKADKFPIGINLDGIVDTYQSHTIQLEKGDSVYIFSDGYADQFGGEKGKKFKYSQFKELLEKNSSNSIDSQRDALKLAFEEWKGSLEQVDDVLVIGLKIG